MSGVPGVTKTHRLTYGKASALYAKANRAQCTSTWSISGRTLKELYAPTSRLYSTSWMTDPKHLMMQD